MDTTIIIDNAGCATVAITPAVALALALEFEAFSTRHSWYKHLAMGRPFCVHPTAGGWHIGGIMPPGNEVHLHECVRRIRGATRPQALLGHHAASMRGPEALPGGGGEKKIREAAIRREIMAKVQEDAADHVFASTCRQ